MGEISSDQAAYRICPRGPVRPGRGFPSLREMPWRSGPAYRDIATPALETETQRLPPAPGVSRVKIDSLRIEEFYLLGANGFQARLEFLLQIVEGGRHDGDHRPFAPRSRLKFVGPQRRPPNPPRSSDRRPWPGSPSIHLTLEQGLRGSVAARRKIPMANREIPHSRQDSCPCTRTGRRDNWCRRSRKR